MRKILPLTLLWVLIGFSGLKSQVTFSLPDLETCDTVVCIPIIVNDFIDIYAFSYTFEWDTTFFKFDTIGDLNPSLNFNVMTDFLFKSEFVDSGFYTNVWAPGYGVTLNSGDTLYNAYFKVVGNIGSSSLFEFTGKAAQLGAANSSGIIPLIPNNGTVSIDDTILPDLTCPNNVVVNTPNAMETINLGLELQALMDNCSDSVDIAVSYSATGATNTPVTSGFANGQTFNASPNNGVTTVTYTAVDEQGNPNTCDFTVTINQASSDLELMASSDTAFCSDNDIEIDINVNNFNNLTSLSFTFRWDPTVFEFDTVGNYNLMDLDVLDFDFSGGNSGFITLGWTDDNASGTTVISGDSIFTIFFNVVGVPGDTSLMQFDDSPTLIVASKVPFTPVPVDTISGMGAIIDTPPIINNCPLDMSVNTDAGTCASMVNWVLPTVSDDCDMPVPALVQTMGGSNGTQFSVGIDTVIYIATDSKMQSDTCTFTVTVSDNENPVAICPTIADVVLDASGNGSLPANIGGSSTDNCSVMSETSPLLTFDCTDIGIHTVTLTVLDSSGNMDMVSCTFNVVDALAPVPSVAMLPNVTGECSATATAPTAVDNCSGTITGTTTDPTAFNTQGTFTITWTYDDGNGNSVDQVQTVVVDDTADPVPDVAVLPNVTGECSAAATAPTAVDNCSGTITGTTTDPTAFNMQGTFTITWTYDDGNGNSVDQVQTVVVDDTADPVPDVAVLPDLAGECSAAATAPTAVDNCSGTITGTTTDPTAFNMQGTFTITWTYDDGNGNSVDQVQTVVVDDTADPVPDVAVLPNVTGECSAAATAPTAVDNCSGTITGTTTDPTAFNMQGTFTITWTYDDGNGNSVDQVQTVVVDDTADPVPDVAVLPDLAGECSAAATAPTAVDNCSGTITGTTTDPTTFSTQGTFTITWTYDDGNGNSVDQVQTVVVDDTADPVPDVAVLPDLAGECSAAATAPTAVDNCSGTITGTTTDPTAFNMQGTFTITWTYDDGNGNSVDQVQTVVVDDTADPVPDVAVLPDLAGECSAAATAPTAVDNCSGTITGTTTDPTAFNMQGTFTITWTYDDGNGNSVDQVQMVVVDDTEPPSLTCPDNQTVDINADCETDSIGYIGMLISLSDNCSDSTDITVVQDSLGIISVGTEVTIVATDEAGNVDSCKFKVLLDDQISPVANCYQDTVVYLDAIGMAIIDATYLDSLSSDNCDSLTYNIDKNTFDCSDIGDNTVTLTVTDGNNNDSTCTTNVVIVDNIPPMLVQCVADTFLLVDSACQVVLPDFRSSVVFGDNCTDVGDLEITQIPPDGTVLTNDTIVAIVALDSMGLVSDTCFFEIEIRDTISPSITCPDSISVITALDSCGAIVDFQLTGMDNCGIDSIYCMPPSGSFFQTGSTTVMCTIMDLGGNLDSCNFNVAVSDGQAPFLSCRADTIITVTTMVSDTMVFDISLDSLFDNCGGIGTTYYHLTGATTGDGTGSDASGESFDMDTTTVTYYAVDTTGNIDSCSFNVIVILFQDVDIECPSDTVQSADNLTCAAELNIAPPIITSTVTLDTVYYTLSGDTSGGGPDSLMDNQLFNVGETVVTYTAVNVTNDTATCSFMVMVTDDETPVVDCPTPSVMAYSDNDTCGVFFTTDIQAASAIDNCSYVLTYNFVMGDLVPVGTNTIIATATDQSNNTDSCSYELMVRDTHPPVIINCPADITMDNDAGECDAMVSWIVPIAKDSCGILFLEATPFEPNDPIGVGTEFITYTASDAAGNVTECIFLVTVKDNEPPTFLNCPAVDTVISEPGKCSAVVSWPFIETDDNCNMESYVISHQSGTTFPIGTSMVQAVAIDDSGQEDTCQFNVVVVDKEFPVMNNFPGNMVINNDPGECGALVTWGMIGTEDNCGVDSFYCNAASGDMFPVGMTEVECTVVDVNGNALTDDFTVIVIDNEDPQITCPDDILINIDGSIINDPSGFIADANPVSCDSVLVTYNGLSGMDNCGIAITTQPTGPVSGTVLSVGVYPLVFEIEDLSANNTACDFTIEVEGNMTPTASASLNANPCEGEDVVFFVQDYTGATYEWRDPFDNIISTQSSFTQPNLIVDMSGVFTVTIDFPYNCTLTADVGITVSPNPILGIISSDLLCASAGTPLMLEAFDDASTGITNFVWSTPLGATFFGNPINVVNPAEGTYSLSVTNASGCTATSSIFIEINAQPEMPDLSGPFSACVGEKIDLDGEEYSGAGIEYHWSAPDVVSAGISDINNHDNEALPLSSGVLYLLLLCDAGRVCVGFSRMDSCGGGFSFI